jgi:hypothetical protein
LAWIVGEKKTRTLPPIANGPRREIIDTNNELFQWGIPDAEAKLPREVFWEARSPLAVGRKDNKTVRRSWEQPM